MVRTTFSIGDYLVFSSLLVASSLIGVFFAIRDRRKANNANFFTGNRKLATFPVVMSLVASFMSTNTLLGVPAEIYQVGTQFAIQILPICIAVILAAEVFMPVYRGLALTSVHEYLELRFQSRPLRLLGSFAFLLATIPYMAVVLFGPSLALSSVTPLSITTSILLVGVICTFYTSIGGIKAVIWTDVLQCILMFIGVIMVIIQGLIEVGGPVEVFRRAAEGNRLIFFNFTFDLYRNDTAWAVLICTLVTWSAIYCVMQTQVQRYCSMRSAADARRALYLNMPGLVLFACLAALCGIVIYAKYHGCDPILRGDITRHDQLMPYFVMDTLSSVPGLAGLFVACAFSGSLSTLSSGFNALAAVTWEDFLQNYLKGASERRTVWITRSTAFIYGLISIGFSFVVGRVGTVLQASFSLNGSLFGPLFAVFLLGMFCPFVTSRSAIVALASGIAMALWVSIGSLVYPRPKTALPSSLDRCPADYWESVNGSYSLAGTYSRGGHDGNNHFSAEMARPEGILRLYHISYLYIPVIGFSLTLLLGLVLSLLGLGDRKQIPANYLSPWAGRLFPWSRHLIISPTSSSSSKAPVDPPMRTDISVPEKAALNGNSSLLMVALNTSSPSSPAQEIQYTSGGGGGINSPLPLKIIRKDGGMSAVPLNNDQSDHVGIQDENV